MTFDGFNIKNIIVIIIFNIIIIINIIIINIIIIIRFPISTQLLPNQCWYIANYLLVQRWPWGARVVQLIVFKVGLDPCPSSSACLVWPVLSKTFNVVVYVGVPHEGGGGVPEQHDRLIKGSRLIHPGL